MIIISKVPWQALVHKIDGQGGMTMDHDHPFCGGVAISPWHVLTAAHCLFPEEVRFLSSNLQGWFRGFN